MNDAISILNLGINNIHSIKRTIELNNPQVQVNVIDKREELKDSKLIVLPGLGSFEAGMRELRKRGLDGYLLDAVEENISILGICLGMQLLGYGSEESPGVSGLGLIEGENRLLPEEPSERIPNVGWMSGTALNQGNLFPSLNSNKDFYFVHSYYFIPENPSHIVFESEYGKKKITTGIMKNRVIGFQFHPEKSSNIGNQLIKEISTWGLNEN